MGFGLLTIFVSALFYANTVYIIQLIHNKKRITENLILGSIMAGFLIFAILILAGIKLI